jgi:two-component system cell cycle response regulator CtrA
LRTRSSGLGFGADDYLTKPFHKDELVASIHAIVRRSKGHAQSVIITGDLTVNLDAEDRGSRRPARASDRQGISDAGAALAAQGHDADQGNVPQPSLRRHGRARAEDHRRVHLQAAQEAGDASSQWRNYIETVWGRGYVLREPPIGNKKGVRHFGRTPIRLRETSSLRRGRGGRGSVVPAP